MSGMGYPTIQSGWTGVLLPAWLGQDITWQDSTNYYLHFVEQVMGGGFPNVHGARVPVPSQWNIPLMSSLLRDYHDHQVVI